MSEPEQLSLDFSPPPRRHPAFSFWHPMTDALDLKYLRVCSVYRLLKCHKIGRARGMELLAQRYSPGEMKTLAGTVDLWRAHPIKDMLP